MRSSVKSWQISSLIGLKHRKARPCRNQSLGSCTLMSKRHQGSGAGVTLKTPTGEELKYVLQIHFTATNNMASMKLYYMNCASLRISESSTLYAVEIPTWWHSKWPEPGRPKIPLWSPT